MRNLGHLRPVGDETDEGNVHNDEDGENCKNGDNLLEVKCGETICDQLSTHRFIFFVICICKKK